MCNGCGQQLQPGWKACPACGVSTQLQPSTSLDVEDSTIQNLTHNVTNITYAGEQPSQAGAPPQGIRHGYCNSCGNTLSDNHFQCLQCRKLSCMSCRSSSGSCLSCNPYRLPSSPGVVRANIVSADSDGIENDATISWDRPADDGGKPISGYTVSIKEIPDKIMEVSDTTHTVMHDIPEGGPYTFMVTASSEIGIGPGSASSPRSEEHTSELQSPE